MIAERPYYFQYAWAYDLLNDRDTSVECEAVYRWLVERGIHPGASILDAGCGTGRYAMHLAERGYVVTGLDASPALIAEAERKNGRRSPRATFRVGSILTLSASSPHDGILCRGVLNDLTNDADRAAAFVSFARVLRPGGVVILDVRDWAATVTRKTADPNHERSVMTPRGTLTFRSVTRLDPRQQLLRISERHTLNADAGEQVADYEFVMRCWTREELDGHLVGAGFTGVRYCGAYDAATPVASTDRLVAVATLGESGTR